MSYAERIDHAVAVADEWPAVAPALAAVAEVLGEDMIMGQLSSKHAEEASFMWNQPVPTDSFLCLPVGELGMPDTSAVLSGNAAIVTLDGRTLWVRDVKRVVGL